MIIYILCFTGEQIKTESGAKAKANKTGIYKRWKERSHSKISLRGTSNEGNVDEATSLAGKYPSYRKLFSLELLVALAFQCLTVLFPTC